MNKKFKDTVQLKISWIKKLRYGKKKKFAYLRNNRTLKIIIITWIILKFITNLWYINKKLKHVKFVRKRVSN